MDKIVDLNIIGEKIKPNILQYCSGGEKGEAEYSENGFHFIDAL